MTIAAATPTRAPKAPRPARAPVPELPAMERLDRTHLLMMDQLVMLQELVQHLADHGVDAQARRSAREICAFFASTARQHHADEEQLIFPPLIRRGDASLTQHVLRLQQDHGWLEEDWLELAPQLQAVAEGYSWYEIDALRHGVGVFVQLYHEHIALEESLIYPEAKRQIDLEAAQAEAQSQARHAAG